MAKRRRRRSKTGIPGLSFSWRRALGVTSAKRKIARMTGIPTSRAGRQRKIGRIVTGKGCLIHVLCILFIAVYALITLLMALL